MLGQTYVVGPHINDNKWYMGDLLGLGFENHIFNVLSVDLEKYYDSGAKIYQTPKARDNGKDIIIESPVSLLDVFGRNFYIKDASALKIYIECKSSDNSKISYNSFAGNLSRIREDNVGYYVLVTNSTIVPFSYYQFKKEAKAMGIEFILIDQYLLSQYLVHNDAMIGKLTSNNNFDSIYIEYQADSCIVEANNAYEIYFWLRNYSNAPQVISMHISTDRNWSTDLTVLEQLVEAKSSYCLKFIAVKEHFDGIADLILNIRGNLFDTSIQLKGINISYNFRPDLVGEENRKTITSLENIITNNSDDHIYLLTGEAGVGKTRIIEEALSSLTGRNINFYRVLAEKNKDILLTLQKLLVKEGYLNCYTTYNSLEDIVSSIDTTYRKCVIIIDDLHNASDKILNSIKNLMTTNMPVGLTLLLVGRNDYSVGSIEYFSFLQFFEEKYLPNIMPVKALTDDEAILLIKSIVRGIPDIALEEIHSLSNNLPLYIIQVIEYMLDLKLVYLLNRNTVGIENVDSFSSHLYIPQGMKELYCQRLKCLNTQTDGKEMIKFLFISSFLGIDFSGNFVNTYFEGKEDLLKTLLERRYIMPLLKDYTFVHESLFLYLQNELFNNKDKQVEVANWLLDSPCTFDKLDKLKQGRVLLWVGNKSEARIAFSAVISDIISIKNYSSININSNYYTYLEDIYKVSTTYKQKKKVIACKIYIALHYHTPYEAVIACNWGQKKLKSNKQYQDDSAFAFYLKEQIAHSYINAGQLKKSEIILADLLSQSILNMDSCDSKAVFDMYDKLSNLYIKYNTFGIAENYINLSIILAQRLDDPNLQALSYITMAKLFLYSDKNKSKHYLYEAKKLLSDENSYRIKCHNNVSILIMTLMELSCKNTLHLKKLITEAENLLDICIKNNFANSVVRIYMLLAVLYYYLEIDTTKNKFLSAIKYIDKGIDMSIKFGISTYIWQFYNLKAVIFVHQNQEILKQKSLFDTIFNILKKQNLTYLGNVDFTYGNVLALTNIMFFYRNNISENFFNQKINMLTVTENLDSCDFDCNKNSCQYECHTSLKLYQKEWNKLTTLKNKQCILFGEITEKYTLQDGTGYYIILS